MGEAGGNEGDGKGGQGSPTQLWGTPVQASWLTATVGAAATVLAALRAAAVIAQARVGGNLFQDDAFYYLVIARNLVASGRLSFDGVHVTTGFHPLWLGVVTMVQALLGQASPAASIVLAVTLVEQALYVAMVGLAAVLAWRAARVDRVHALGFLAVALWCASPLAWVFRQGMETTLAALLAIVMLQAFVAQRPALLGMALALLVLARLDTAAFIGVPVLLFTCNARHDLRSRLLATTPATLALLAVVAANLALTGHPLPISGTLKSSFPWPRWQPGFIAEPLRIAAHDGVLTLATTYNSVLLLALVLVAMAMLAWSGARRRGHGELWAAWTCAALLALNLLVFQRWEKSIDPRYFALPMMFVLFVLGSACALLVRGGATKASRDARAQPGRATLAAFTLLVMASATLLAARATWRDVTPPPARDALTALMLDIDATLPRDAVVAGTDVGALAFWTRRRVVNLDGVVNDYAYQDALRDGHLAAWLAAAHVTHVATGLWDRAPGYTARPVEPMYRQGVDAAAVAGGDYGTHRYYVYSYRHGRYSDSIALRARDEVFRRDLGQDAWNHTVFVIYAMPPAPAATP